MNVGFLIKGFIIGFIIGVPAGPVGALIIQRILSMGSFYGLISGIGSAVADLMYGIIIAYGLTFISDILIVHQTGFRIIGGIVVSLVGIKIFLSKPMERAVDNKISGLVKNFISTFILSATSPTTIFSFLAIFVSYGIVSETNYDAAQLVIGVFCGASIWWIILIFVVSMFRKKVTQKNLGTLNKVFGVVIMVFGLAILGSLIKPF